MSKDIRQQRREETEAEIMELFKTGDKAMCVRPMGYGKTYMAVDLTAKFNRTLYLYPRTIIGEQIKKDYGYKIKDKDITFLTYVGLVTLDKEGKIEEEIAVNNLREGDIVILDEAHFLGGDKTKEAVKKMMEISSGAKFLGITATPKRLDEYNFIEDIFDNRTCSKYDLNDAIADGYYEAPRYVYALYTIEEEARKIKILKDRIKASKLSKYKQGEVIRAANSMLIKYYKNVGDVSEIIRRHMAETGQDLNYMKFIVFFSNTDTLYSKMNDVKKWFKKAYPEKRVRSMVVASDNYKNQSNRDKFMELEERDNTIDLVFSIDMLTMGYHVSNLSGVVMMRCTQSDTIYLQQLGRCLSVDSKHKQIVFDFVGNCNVGDKDESEKSVLDKHNEKRKKKDDEEEQAEITRGTVDMIDEVAGIDKIERMLRAALSSADKENGLLEACCDAYLTKGAPLEFCTNRLSYTEEKFLGEVKKYKEWLENDKCDRP